MADAVLDQVLPPSAHDATLGAEAWSRQRAVMLAFSRRICTSDAAATALIDDAALLLAETLGAPMCGSFIVSDDGSKLLARLHAADGAAREMRAPWSPTGPGTESLAAYCLARHEVVVCADLTDAPFRDVFLRTSGVKSAFAIPLESPGGALGAVAVLSTTPRAFTSQEVEFAEAIGHMLAATLGRIQSDRALQNERNVAAAMFEKDCGIALLIDLEGHVIRASQDCQELLGDGVAALLGRPLSSCLTNEGAQEAHRMARAAALREPASGMLTFRSRQGHERKVAVKARALFSGGKLPDMIAFNGQLEPAPAASVVQPFQQMPDPEAPVRSSPRRAFPYRQRIAPFEPGKPLADLPFVEVQFEDISAGGVSFYLAYRPEFETVVLALGVGANLHYLTATILNATEVMRAGRQMFKVGCRFLERH